MACECNVHFSHRPSQCLRGCWFSCLTYRVLYAALELFIDWLEPPTENMTQLFDCPVAHWLISYFGDINSFKVKHLVMQYQRRFYSRYAVVFILLTTQHDAGIKTDMETLSLLFFVEWTYMKWILGSLNGNIAQWTFHNQNRRFTKVLQVMCTSALFHPLEKPSTKDKRW